MARKLFEKQGIRTRAGALATGTVFVVYTDSAGTTLADISTTSGGSAIAGSTVTVTDRDGLGLATLLFYGPTDGTDTLYLRCPDDTSLGVQEVEADEDERLDALVAGSGIPPSLLDAKGDIIAASAADTAARLAVGANDTVLTADSTTGTGLKWAAGAAHPNLATHDALGLATDAELATHAAAANPHPVYATDTDLSTHEADTTAIHGITDTSALATTSGVTSAVSTHAGLTDPHTGYVLESLYDAKGDLLPASADNTPAKLTVGANDTVLTADSTAGTGLKWAAPAAHPNLATHDSLGLATDAELAAHEADTTSIHGIANTALLAKNTDVQIFTSAGTWTKPTGALAVSIVVIGGGGGGGSARRGAAGTVRSGGGGGGGAGITRRTMPASAFGATVAVTVGTSGAGGTAVTTNDTNGNAGGSGGNSNFADSWGGEGGSGGAGDTDGASGGPSNNAGMWAGMAGGTSDSAGGAGGLGGQGQLESAAGGGGGGGITAANAESAGGFGGGRPGSAGSGANGSQGTAGGGAGGAGTNNAADSGICGSAGGGGGSSITTAGGTGGAGGRYGGGGGGGGASLNGNNSGAGGAGSPGVVIVITTF